MNIFKINPELKIKLKNDLKKIKSNSYYTKSNIYTNFIDDPNNSIGQIIDKFLIICISISALTIIFESIGNYQIIYSKQLFLIDFIISVVFALEYFYRFFKSAKKINFIFSKLNIIDLLSFLPFFIEIILKQNTGMDILKILRLFKVFRIFRIFRHMPIIVGFMKAMKDYKDEYKSVGFLMLTTMVVVSVFVYYVEGSIANTKFENIPITLRWALVTMTTVGYGDMYPQTGLGKILGSIIILLGPVLLALISSITTLVFIETSKIQRQLKRKERFKECPRCRVNNEIKNNYCYNCGEKIF